MVISGFSRAMQRYDKYGSVKWRWPCLCLLCVVLYACHKRPIEPMLPDADEITLIFSAKLPSASQGIKTYALSDADENFLKDIDVLVFRSEEHTSELQSRENLVCR